MVVIKIVTTEVSRCCKRIPSRWGPNDQPGVPTAAARAAIFLTGTGSVLLNRVLIIDPQQPDALTVLTVIYSALLL